MANTGGLFETLNSNVVPNDNLAKSTTLKKIGLDEDKFKTTLSKTLATAPSVMILDSTYKGGNLRWKLTSLKMRDRPMEDLDRAILVLDLAMVLPDLRLEGLSLLKITMGVARRHRLRRHQVGHQQQQVPLRAPIKKTWLQLRMDLDSVVFSADINHLKVNICIIRLKIDNKEFILLMFLLEMKQMMLNMWLKNLHRKGPDVVAGTPTCLEQLQSKGQHQTD